VIDNLFGGLMKNFQTQSESFHQRPWQSKAVCLQGVTAISQSAIVRQYPLITVGLAARWLRAGV
jgi:hypothetical protein